MKKLLVILVLAVPVTVFAETETHIVASQVFTSQQYAGGFRIELTDIPIEDGAISGCNGQLVAIASFSTQPDGDIEGCWKAVGDEVQTLWATSHGRNAQYVSPMKNYYMNPDWEQLHSKDEESAMGVK